MKLFDLRADYDSCCSFVFRKGEDIHMWDERFEGTPCGDSYPVPKGERDDEGIDGPLPDFTCFALRPYPTFSERVISTLGDLLSLHGEFALIEMGESMPYFAFNPTTVVDFLDEEKSQIKRFTDGGVMRVERYALLETVTSLPPIFKMPQTRVGQTYVNEQFVAAVQRHRLSGFRFDLLFER